VELPKAFPSREPPRAEPGRGERRANGEGAPPRTDVDELITSLVDAVDRSEEAIETTVELPTETVRIITPRRRLIRKLRRARELVGPVAFYLVATVALGIAIGLLAGHVLP
jgi:hypothetical protein